MRERPGYHDIIVVGASAGGIGPCLELLGEIPSNFPAAIFIVIHIPPSKPSMLPRIFSRATRLNVIDGIKDGDVIRPGQVYVAPSDYHLLLKFGGVELGHGPRENWARPAIDALFRSAARIYRSRVIGIVLSGVLYDGTAGLSAIKEYGGIVMVQDPDEALHPEMPLSALQNLSVDYCLPVAQMPARLMHLVQGTLHSISQLPRIAKSQETLRT
ncbi:MAG: chemotaxis protein CheB [Verrucomicrobiota bacterium]